MSDPSLNYYLARGTNADRLAFTPTPPSPAAGPENGYIFYETDTGDVYGWDGAAWQLATGSGISQLTGDVTAGPGSGSQAATIANDAVTNAKAANMAQSTIKGRAVGSGAGDPTDLTATQATAILDNVVGDSGAGGTKGLVPAPAAGDAAAGKYLGAGGNYSPIDRLRNATFGTPAALADGDIWVEVSGVTPTRTATLMIRDGGVTIPMLTIAY